MTESTQAEVEERVEVGPWVLAVLRPRDAEALLDEEAFTVEEFIPYWADLWPSGLALARHVAALDVAGLRVLELGCGLALPSLAAACGGAAVTATDWAGDAVDLLRRNASRNGLRLRALPLRWDAEEALAGEEFDLVLAADVLYEARNAAPLLRLLDRTVGPAGEAIVADPGRRHASAFFEEASATWEIEVIREMSLPGGALHRLRRRSRD